MLAFVNSFFSDYPESRPVAIRYVRALLLSSLPLPANTLTLLKHKLDHVILLFLPLQRFCILFRTKSQVLTLAYKALCVLASCHYSDLLLSFFLAHFYTGLLAGPQACSCLKVLETAVPSPWYAHPSEIHMAHSLTSSPLQHSK